MARYRRKKALYEVIGKSRVNSRYDRALKPPHEEKGDGESVVEGSAVEMSKIAAQWPRRPKFFQFNAGRIEISMPWQLAVALLLLVVLSILVVFRLGQGSGSKQGLSSGQGEAIVDMGQTVKADETGLAAEDVSAVGAPKPSAVEEKPKGNNRIVITQYRTSRDLEPVRKYFADNGIETKIEKRSGWFFLVTTKDTYENPQRAGTNGAAALEKIKDVGAGYKAQQGYDSFAPTLFSDAYGEKVR